MSLTRKIALNTTVQIAGKIVSTVIGLMAIGMIGRYLGREGMGNYTTIIAFLQFFGILVDMGLYIILIKKISEPEIDEEKVVNNIFTLRLLSAVIFLGLAPLFVLFFPYPPMVKWGVALTTFSFLFITLNQALSGVFQKKLRMDKVAIAEVAGRAVLLGGTFLAILLEKNLLYIMLAVVLGSLVNFLAIFYFTNKYIKIKLHFDFDIWKKVMKEAWPVALAILFNLVYFKADTIILSLYKSQSDVGIYGASYKVLEVLSTFPAMFAGLMMPLLTKSFQEKNIEQFKKILRKAFDALIMVMIPMVVGTYFIAEKVMVFIFGQDFKVSGTVLQILIVATGIIFMGNLFGNSVVAVNRQRQILWAYGAIAIISVAGYFIFIPVYSYFGAAWITVISEFLITFASAYVVFRATKVGPSFRLFFKSLLASIGMGAILFLFRSQSLFILILFGFIVYTFLLYLFKGFSKELVLEVISPRSNNRNNEL